MTKTATGYYQYRGGSDIKIKYEFREADNGGTGNFYHVFCVTYRDGQKDIEHEIAHAHREKGIGLRVFPLAGNDGIHKMVRDAYLREFDEQFGIHTKAKWDNEGFLFRERQF